jgi:hypothetical protein
MSRFGLWLARSPLATAAKTLVAVLLTLAVAEWASTGEISFDRVETWVIVGLGSVIPMIANWLNPSDPRYGKVELEGSQLEDPADGHYPGEQA